MDALKQMKIKQINDLNNQFSADLVQNYNFMPLTLKKTNNSKEQTHIRLFEHFPKRDLQI